MCWPCLGGVIKMIFQTLFCKHKWEHINRYNLYWEGEDREINLPHKSILTRECTKCGKIRRDRI